MAISFAVSSWSGWTSLATGMPQTQTSAVTDSAPLGVLGSENPGIESPILISQSPDVSIIPPLLRRRLNPMGRACVSEMLRHLREGDNPAVVYCSRHGDIERTLSVLKEQASGEPLSPMNFSLAVHNAIAGVISIHQLISANISSIAAGEEPLVPVLLEAAGLLSDDCPAVLCVFCDVPLPEIYRSPQEQVPAPYATCFRITRDQGLALELQLLDEADTGAKVQTAPLTFVEFLSSTRDTFSTLHNGGQWAVRKTNHIAGQS